MDKISKGVDNLLFTGDTLSIQKNKIKPFFFLQDMSTSSQKESIKKLLKIDNTKLICTGHYGCLKK